MKERFFVGDDPVLVRTRVYMLRIGAITTACTREATEAIKAQRYDLLIIGQTVDDETAKNLIALANKLYPPATSLVICSIGGADRHFGTATYRVDLSNPGGFRSAVASLLDSRPIAWLLTSLKTISAAARSRSRPIGLCRELCSTSGDKDAVCERSSGSGRRSPSEVAWSPAFGSEPISIAAACRQMSKRLTLLQKGKCYHIRYTGGTSALYA